MVYVDYVHSWTTNNKLINSAKKYSYNGTYKIKENCKFFSRFYFDHKT